jgi:hypothetical protein
MAYLGLGPGQESGHILALSLCLLRGNNKGRLAGKDNFRLDKKSLSGDFLGADLSLVKGTGLVPQFQMT